MNASSTLDLLVTVFDTNVVSRATMLSLYNERYRQAVADSLWLTTEYAIGTTTAAQSRYAVADDVVDLRQVYLGTYSAPATYDVVSQKDLLAVRDTNLEAWIRGDGAGVFSQGFSSTGVAYIDLEPAPSVTGTAIVGVAPILPADLTDTTGAAGTPKIPADFHMGLFYGTKADLYRLQDEREDLAQVNDALFADVVGKLAGRHNTRFGSGARQVSVAVGGR